MIPLDTIIEDLQGEQGLETQHNYAHLLRFAVRAVEDLWTDVTGSLKRVELEPDSNGIVQLPEDFVKESTISLISSTGHLMFLGRNDKIYKPLDNCGNPTPTQSNLGYSTAASGTNGSQHVKNGEVIGAYYGVGGKQTAGEFSLNRAENRIELSSNLTSSTIVLEYIARPTQINGRFMVHEFLQDAIMCYIMWKSQRQFDRGSAKQLHRDYKAAKIAAKIKFQGMSEQEMLEVSRLNFSMSPKY